MRESRIGTWKMAMHVVMMDEQTENILITDLLSEWLKSFFLIQGMSLSLYETNMITKESTGNPIADCYGLVVRGNSIAMVSGSKSKCLSSTQHTANSVYFAYALAY